MKLEKGIEEMDVHTAPGRILNGPWRITFDTNPDDCNLHCIMCEEHSGFSPKLRARLDGGCEKRQPMDFDIIRNVVAECAPFGLREIIPSTMGEPLLYHRFPDIVDLCIEYDVKLNVTTNGSFPGRTAGEWAELVCPVGSDVKISWNGLTKEVQEGIMVGSPLGKRFVDLRDFIGVRDRFSDNGGNPCSITLQLTFMERNLQELPEIVKFSIDHGIDRVKGHHLWTHFPEIRSENLRRSLESVRRWNMVVKDCHDIAQERRMKDGRKIMLTNFDALDPMHRERLHPHSLCPFLGHEAWVNHEGRFDPCCAPDDLRRSLGSLGNVKDDGLLSLWNSKGYQELVQHHDEHELCRGCNMRVSTEEHI